MLVVCVPRVKIHGDGWRALVFDLRRCSCVCVLLFVCACVDSKRLCVCRQNTHVLCDTGVLLAHTEAF